MFEWFRKRKAEELMEQAERYLLLNYREPAPPKKEPDVDHSYNLDAVRAEQEEQAKEAPETGRQTGDIKFSLRDNYNSSTIQTAMRSLSDTGSPLRTLKTLDAYTDVSFVDKMLDYINDKRLRDAEVYKAAQLDRRLFSKIVSDSSYKPAKDTCVALCFALHLTLPEANDLLSRAGYTFSHSNKRDVILEFFFREQVYDLDDVNEILFRLGQKTLGR